MAQYPGHDTEFFIVVNGVTTGPLVGLEQVIERHISPDTPVWYEGLSDWQPAIMAPLTRQLFMPDSEFYRARTSDLSDNSSKEDNHVPVDEPKIEPVHRQSSEIPHATAYASSHEADAAAAVERPKPFLIWAIVVTVIFNIICGAIAIIYSIKVKSKTVRGDCDSAARCSVTAQWWIATGICVGLIMTVYNLFTGGFFLS